MTEYSFGYTPSEEPVEEPTPEPEATVEETPEPKPKRRRKPKKKTVEVRKVRGGVVKYQDETFDANTVYEVAPKVAEWLLALRDGRGNPYFESA